MVWQLQADHEQKQALGDVTITRGLDANRPITEALQLRSEFDVGVTGGGLMGSSPERPCDDVGRSDAPLSQSRCHAPDLLNGPADQNATRRALPVVFGGAIVLA